MKFLTADSWDEAFFDRFAEFKNSIHRDIITSFPETAEDYAKFFGPASLFTSDYGWKAFAVTVEGKTQAQAILCWRRGGEAGNLGFLDWVNDVGAAKELISNVTSFARERGIRSIKAPVDMNFFVKYRIRLPGGEKPFYGEPVYPDYYHELFRHSGLMVVGQWDSYKVKRLRALRDFRNKERRLGKMKEGLVIRGIRMAEWEKELRIIYDLFIESYRTMPEYEPLNFEQFRVLYGDFKYIVQPRLSCIVEYQGQPIAFNVSFMDPLPILSEVKGKKLNAFQKAVLLARLRINRGSYLLAHVGKISGPAGGAAQGIQIRIACKVILRSLGMRQAIACFQNVDSPARRSWNPEVISPYAKYVLYGMDL